MAKIISRIILLLFVLTLYGCNLQRNMLYYPSAYLPSPASLAAHNIQFWPSDSNDYRGFIGTLQVNTIKGTIVIFHGNAGTAADRIYYVNTLTHLGYRVILAEYPGYGGRKGELVEEPFVATRKKPCA
jgi:pimeloyl-ACP methyl ester carboxylesterase